MNTLEVKNQKENPNQKTAGVEKEYKNREEILSGLTVKIPLNCGNLYLIVNNDAAGRPFEVFIRMGKVGCCAGSHLEALARMISLALRNDVSAREIVDQLKSIRCPEESINNGRTYLSCSDAVAQTLERIISKGGL